MINTLRNSGAVLLLLSGPAMAGFVNNYADWKKAPPEAQTVYLMGALDAQMQSKQKGEPEWLAAKRRGMANCIRKTNPDAAMLVELVNTHYAKYPSDWRFPPVVVLFDAIGHMCLPDMNEERAKIGLPAWPRQPEQLAPDSPQ